MALLLHLDVPLIEGKKFKGVKFVCVGGSPRRMSEMARIMRERLHAAYPNLDLPLFENENKDRYSIFRVGPVLFVNHGIGGPSILIVLHEVCLLLKQAECKDVVFFRIGTCGGIDVDPGTVIITDEVFSSSLENHLTLNILGKSVKRPAILNLDFIDEIYHFSQEQSFDFPVIRAKTMCTNDFFEEQGRLDGAVVEYNEKEKFDFLQHLKEKGIRNIEMESLYLAAFCHKMNIKCVIVCVVLLNRMLGDHFIGSAESSFKWKDRALNLVIDFIITKLQNHVDS